MNFQSLQISLTKEHPQYREVLAFYQDNIEKIFKTTMALSANTAIASSEDEATDLIESGCESIVVFGPNETTWMGIENIIVDTFTDCDLELPENGYVREAFLESVCDGIVSDVITLIGSAFTAMDELAEN
jgi:hypothetical protein